MTTEEQRKQEARESKFFTIAFLSAFLIIPTSVIGYNVINWAKQNDVVKSVEKKKDDVKQKIISFVTSSSKVNNR